MKNLLVCLPLITLFSAGCALESSSVPEASVDEPIDVASAPIQGGERDYGDPAIVRVLPVSCTGTLIAPRWVLTAKHCLGRVSTVLTNGTISTAVVETFPHPSAGVDQALLYLADPVLSVMPLPYNTSTQPAVGTRCKVAGYGIHNNPDGTITGGAKYWGYVDVTLSSPTGYMEATFGTAIPDKGDSGGPLICTNAAFPQGSVTAVVTGHNDGDWPAHRVEGFSAVAATWIRDTVDNHAPVPIHKGTTFSPETNGVWQLVDYDHDGIPDLTYIKTSNTTSGRVEVFVASGASGYQSRTLATATTFGAETNGVWQLVDYDHDGIPDLTYIKTSNTTSGRVEVFVASGASGYQSRTLATATTFGAETNGVWQLVDYDHDGIPDLTYIKTSNTTSGRVEVFVASGASGYQSRTLATATTFGAETNGVWQLVDYDHDGIPDLTYIKTSNTTSGRVEVFVASGTSGYQIRVLSTPTPFRPEADGVWQLVDYDQDGTFDLAFIKTSNTGSGTVEVHVAPVE
ncbi:trypsin-like serine protease [Sorangium sp. So ce117]|uniref:trypsin-like serine protease n=1 Tax=Sorangium sp. So ce117 TaxID=3133277 RepID=UPI003F6000D4